MRQPGNVQILSQLKINCRKMPSLHSAMTLCKCDRHPPCLLLPLWSFEHGTRGGNSGDNPCKNQDKERGQRTHAPRPQTANMWTLSMEICLMYPALTPLHPKTFYGEGKPQLDTIMQSLWIKCVWVSPVSQKEWEISHPKSEKVLSETQTVPRLQRKTEAGEIILWSNSLLNYPWILWPDLKQKFRKIS